MWTWTCVYTIHATSAPPCIMLLLYPRAQCPMKVQQYNVGRQPCGRMSESSDWVGFVIKVWQMVSNLDAVNYLLLCSNQTRRCMGLKESTRCFDFSTLLLIVSIPHQVYDCMTTVNFVWLQLTKTYKYSAQLSCLHLPMHGEHYLESFGWDSQRPSWWR